MAADHVHRSFDPERPARLAAQVALRPEPFGALAYHYGTRRLVFVKSPVLVQVLEDLGAHDSVRAAVDAHASAAEAPRFLDALSRLHDDGVLDAR
jgi:putative mycofactocin binding protein MftB